METKLAKKRGPKPSGVKTEVLFKRVPVKDKELLSVLVDGAMDSGKAKDGMWFYFKLRENLSDEEIKVLCPKGSFGYSLLPWAETAVPANPSHSDRQGVSTPTNSVIEASRVPDSEVKALRDRISLLEKKVKEYEQMYA